MMHYIKRRSKQVIIKYRPHKGTLQEAMSKYKEFATLDEMYEHIVSNQNGSDTGMLFSKEDLSVGENLGSDDRIGWKETRYVCTSRFGNKKYPVPICIGMCSME